MMKNINLTIITLTMTGILGTTGISAMAESSINTAQVANPSIVLNQLPKTAQGGSIEVGDVDEQTMYRMAKLTAAEAADIATHVEPGIVVEMQIGSENNTLTWEVTELTADNQEIQLKLDAGNGRVLAAEIGEHNGDGADHEQNDDHVSHNAGWWKFWQEHDNHETADHHS